MSSSPLFIKVAESIVTFAPIDQFGCLSACSTVAALITSALAVRNGPPEAVRITRRTSSRRLPLMAWNNALCSESTGNTVAPAAAARRSEERRVGKEGGARRSAEKQEWRDG